MTAAEPIVPDYAGACLARVVPALLARADEPWLPAVARQARQVVLLTLDGLGWGQLVERERLAPVLSAMAGGPITSVVPTTTATALTSLTTGAAPSAHGIVGYRMRVDGDRILNVLRWRTGDGDAIDEVPPGGLQPLLPFGGGDGVAVVTKREFRSSGFTEAHLAGVAFHGWSVASSIPVEVGRLLADGTPFVYAYYDGIDRVAHERGFGPHYDAEVAFVDRLVGEVLGVLPPGACLVVTSDHGQVEVGPSLVDIDERVGSAATLVSGEGRFRWLHVPAGRVEATASVARDLYESDGTAWVRTYDEIAGAGWLGGTLAPEVRARLGDVALVARRPVAFRDENDAGSESLVCRHGSLTADEMLVPLVAASG